MTLLSGGRFRISTLSEDIVSLHTFDLVRYVSDMTSKSGIIKSSSDFGECNTSRVYHSGQEATKMDGPNDDTCCPRYKR